MSISLTQGTKPEHESKELNDVLTLTKSEIIQDLSNNQGPPQGEIEINRNSQGIVFDRSKTKS